ncbi:YeeE/YedE family protein [Candidatus Woesearchaeota archaeon]|nr:YeeE/YedE family protein [Candidatus Woesearchaeota archaeon]
MLEQFFPTGISQFLLGGLLVGLGISFIFISTGLVAGASTFFTSTWSYVSKLNYFKNPKFLSSRNWRSVLAISLVLGGFLFMFFFNEGKAEVTEVQIWRIALGGFLVGLGTRMADGCPSGHGICGLSSLELPSLVSVLTFLSIAIVVALTVSSMGVLP